MIVRVLEHDPAGAIQVQGIGNHGTVEVIASLRLEGDSAYLDQLHIDGPGPGSIGIHGLLEFGRELGR